MGAHFACGFGSIVLMISDRFGVDAQELRSAFHVGFYNVFSMSDVLRIDRSSHAKTSKKTGVSGSKSKPGPSRSGPDEPKNRRKT